MLPIDLKIGDALTNAQLSALFECGRMGGIRVSKATNTIVVIVNSDASEYGHFWRGNTLYYQAGGGAGRSGLSLDFGPNRQLLNANKTGMTIVLFERYVRNEYIYRGPAIVQEVQEAQLPNEFGNSRPAFFFLLHPVRHLIPHAALAKRNSSTIDLKIMHNEAHWEAYLFEKALIYARGPVSEATRHSLFSSIWREYASSVTEIFLSKFESLAPGLIAYEYDLEKGSIKATITVLASVATLASATVKAIGDYPNAKAAWPVVKADVTYALKEAELELERRLNGARIEIAARWKERSRQNTLYPSIGPANARRRISNNSEEL